MYAMTFDSLSYFERLVAVGVSEKQAKVQVEVMQEAMQSKDIVTKSDIAFLEKEVATKSDIDEIKNETEQNLKQHIKEIFTTKADLADLKIEIRQDIHNLDRKIDATKHELLKWFVGLLLANTAIILSVVGFMLRNP